MFALQTFLSLAPTFWQQARAFLCGEYFYPRLKSPGKAGGLHMPRNNADRVEKYCEGKHSSLPWLRVIDKVYFVIQSPYVQTLDDDTN